MKTPTAFKLFFVDSIIREGTPAHVGTFPSFSQAMRAAHLSSYNVCSHNDCECEVCWLPYDSMSDMNEGMAVIVPTTAAEPRIFFNRDK